MKHLIIGSGTIGTATGIWLNANKQDVIFCDIKLEILKKLKNKGYKVTKEIKQKGIDIYWICTAEWDTEKIIKNLSKKVNDPFIVIRSTMPPGETLKLAKKYKIKHFAHVPEFLRQKVAISDIFNKDRIIIGTKDKKIKSYLENIYNSETVEIIFTDTTTSELIKYAANCWLSTQISYWNEIKKICDTFNVNPQMVANAACLDKRISKYGTAMIGEPFGGFCFPKDMDALIKSFEKNNLDPILLKAVRKVNNIIKKQKTK